MINGPLHGGAVAADVSAAAVALNKSTRRSVNHPPTKIHHLNDAVVIRQISIAERTAMKVAKVTQPPPGINMGAAITWTIMITVVTVLRASVNGGGASQQLLDHLRSQLLTPAAAGRWNSRCRPSRESWASRTLP